MKTKDFGLAVHEKKRQSTVPPCRLPLGWGRVKTSWMECVQIQSRALLKFERFEKGGGVCYRLYENLFIYDPGYVIVRNGIPMLDATFPEDVLAVSVGQEPQQHKIVLAKVLAGNKNRFKLKSGLNKYDLLVCDQFCELVEQVATPIDAIDDPHQNPALSDMLTGNSTEPYVQYLLKTLHGAKP